MLTVTRKIKELLKARDARIIDGQSAVLALLQEVRKQILGELASLPGESYAAFNLRRSLDSIERHLADFESTAKRELGTGLFSTWEMGRDLLPQTAATAGVSLGFGWISTGTIDALKDFTWGRISAVTSDAYNRIRGEVLMGILGTKTPQEVTSAIAGTLQRPGVFKSINERAEVITGTEMGRAYSMATDLSIEAAADTLPEIERMWLHAGHPKKPRQVHLFMHGQRRKPGKAFYTTLEGMKVMYPRDPKAPIKEVIRCGCTHVPYMAAWGDAAEFAAQFDKLQAQANQPRRS